MCAARALATKVFGGVLALLTDGGSWQAPMMVAGYLAILVENVLRAGRDSRPS